MYVSTNTSDRSFTRVHISNTAVQLSYSCEAVNVVHKAQRSAQRESLAVRHREEDRERVEGRGMTGEGREREERQPVTCAHGRKSDTRTGQTFRVPTS